MSQGVFAGLDPATGRNNCVYNNNTFGTASGFSVAALSSQAISDISQTTTTQTLEAVRERRIQETERCPVGFVRENGECVRVRRAEPRPAPRQNIAVVKAPPAEPLAISPISPAVWFHTFGDYERRTNLSPQAQDNFGNTVNLTSRTLSAGVLGGTDLTFRGLTSSADALVLGVMGGYTTSEIQFGGTPNTNVKAQLEGPSAGVYATYFNGGFSTDASFKADFFHLNEDFSEVFPPSVNNGTTLTATVNGSAVVQSTNLITAANINYKFFFNDYWIEPTVGFRYTTVSYSNDAQLLGLTDGHFYRVQGGARFGTSFLWNSIRVTPTVTGLLYSDLDIQGLVLQDTFFTPTLLPSDEGKLRAQGILAVNFDLGLGLSSFVQAEFRGGQDLFGATGKLGVRYQF